MQRSKYVGFRLDSNLWDKYGNFLHALLHVQGKRSDRLREFIDAEVKCMTGCARPIDLAAAVKHQVDSYRGS